MAAAVFFAGATRFLLSEHQNSNRGHREVEKKLANSPRVFLWPEKVRGKGATRGGGKFFSGEIQLSRRLRLGQKKMLS